MTGFAAWATRAQLRELRYGLLLVPGTLAVALTALGLILSSLERHTGARGFDLVFTGMPRRPGRRSPS